VRAVQDEHDGMGTASAGAAMTPFSRTGMLRKRLSAREALLDEGDDRASPRIVFHLSGSSRRDN
jgi:hypothetical protein